MSTRTAVTFLFLAFLPLCCLAGVGPTLGEHEALERLIEETPDAALVAVEHHGGSIEVKVRYDDDFRRAIDFSDRIMSIFSLTFVDKDWSILSLEPERAVTLRRKFRGTSRPCGSVMISCDESCTIGVNFPFRCDTYSID